MMMINLDNDSDDDDEDYVSDDDEDLKVLSEWLDESESLFVHKEISNAFQTYSKVFTLTSDQLKGFILNLGII